MAASVLERLIPDREAEAFPTAMAAKAGIKDSQILEVRDPEAGDTTGFSPKDQGFSEYHELPDVFQCAEKCCFPIEVRACHHLYELVDGVDAGGVYKAEVSTFLRRNCLSRWDLDVGAQMQEHLRVRVDAISTRTQGAPSREHEELHVQGKRTR